MSIDILNVLSTFSDQCWNRACYCTQLRCPTPKAPKALLRAKKRGIGIGENKKELVVLPKSTITALVPTLSWVPSDRLRIYTHIQLAHTRPPRLCIHLVYYAMGCSWVTHIMNQYFVIATVYINTTGEYRPSLLAPSHVKEKLERFMIMAY